MVCLCIYIIIIELFSMVKGGTVVTLICSYDMSIFTLSLSLSLLLQILLVEQLELQPRPAVGLMTRHFFLFSFETKSCCVVQVILQLTMQSSPASNSQQTCLSLPSMEL